MPLSRRVGDTAHVRLKETCKLKQTSRDVRTAPIAESAGLTRKVQASLDHPVDALQPSPRQPVIMLRACPKRRELDERSPTRLKIRDQTGRSPGTKFLPPHSPPGPSPAVQDGACRG